MLKCTEDSFFRVWFEFLAPFHRLTSRERDVAARLLRQYFRLKAGINDPEVLKEVMWSKTSKADMMRSLGMSATHFKMTISRLKSAGVLIDGAINPKFIPHMGGGPRHVLCVAFDWSSPSDRVGEGKNG